MGVIRLLLAIAVFNSHYSLLGLPVVDGHEAVLAFFAISGFYMALILDTSYTTRSAFYFGRLISLYPMYVLALCISIALVVTADIHPMSSKEQLQTLLSDPLSLGVMIWTSACTLGQELLFSLSQSADGQLNFVQASREAIWNHAPLIQAWSLSLEVTFYALAPFLTRMKSTTLTTLIISSLCLKLAILFSPLSDIVFFKRFFLAEFWLFGCGILSYRVHTQLREEIQLYDYAMVVLLVAAVLVADSAPEPLKHFCLPAVTLISLPFVFRASKSAKLDRDIGKVSYPFYLLHFSVIAVFENYWEEPVGWHILAFALAAAFVTHFFFNPGIEFLKQKLRSRQHPYLTSRKAETAGIPAIKP